MEERLVKLEQTVRMQRLMMLGLFVVLCGGVVMGFDKEKKIASYEQLEVQTLVVHSKKLGAMGDSDVEVIRIGSDMDGHGLIELHGYDAEDHRTQCRDLASKGYRPIAIAAASPRGGPRRIAE